MRHISSFSSFFCMDFVKITVSWFNWYIFAMNYYYWTRAKKTKGKDPRWGLGPPLRSQDVLESRRWGRYSELLYERRCQCRCCVADGPPRSHVPLVVPSRSFNKTRVKKRNKSACVFASWREPGCPQARLYKHACTRGFRAGHSHLRASPHRSQCGFVEVLVDDQ